MLITIDIRSIILLFLLLVLGIVSSYYDIKHRRISNRHIGLAIILGLVLNLSFRNHLFTINFLFNFIFAAGIGFLLWYIWFWNAGDGKLLLGFISLIPIEIVFRSKTFLYSYEIMFYTFVPVFFVLLVLLLARTKMRDIKELFKNYLAINVVFHIFIAFFAFHWAIVLFKIYTGVNLNMFLSIIVLFLLFGSIEKIFKINFKVLFILTAILRVIFDFKTITTMDFIIEFIINFTIFLILVYLVLHLAFIKYAKHVKIQDLRPGMLLAEKVVKAKKKYSVEPVVYISLFSFLVNRVEGDALIDVKPTGITSNDINLLKKLHKNGSLRVGSILIQGRLPFAPFLFLGVLIHIFISIYSGF